MYLIIPTAGRSLFIDESRGVNIAMMGVFDLIYNPIETRLLKEARSLGAVTVNGLTMLVHQGAASFELWTGKKAPLGIMMKSALQEIGRRGIKRS